MYKWRQMDDKQRAEILANRRANLRPWHSPPHFEGSGTQCYHLSAACYEHAPIIGVSPFRMEQFESRLVEFLSTEPAKLYAWCVLPNHWHALVRVDPLKTILKGVGLLHGRTSFLWNQEDDARGRKCWHRCSDRRIRSDRHFHTAMNYIHHNAVKHGYVAKWEEWPYSSADTFITEAGREAAARQWMEYPVLDMGSGWDD